MGFFDSFTTGLSNVFGSIGSGISSFGSGLSSALEFGGGFLGGVAGSPIGQAFLGPLVQSGAAAFTDLIGLAPAGFTGSSGITGAPRGLPVGPLGSPAGFLTPVGSFSQPRPDQLLTPGGLQEELAFFQPGGPGTPTRGAFPGALLQPTFAGPAPVRPLPFGPAPSVPSNQPFGVMPGTGGFPLPAFPIATQASFPASPFALATGTPGFQQAGIAGSLLRQLPGIVGGFAGGAALDAFAGGGPSTPMFRPTMAGARAMFFRTANPVTGQDTWFRPAGRPILWSGDVNACKRVKKVARLARRKR